MATKTLVPTVFNVKRMLITGEANSKLSYALPLYFIEMLARVQQSSELT